MTGIIVDTNDMIELREVIIRTMKNLDIYIFTYVLMINTIIILKDLDEKIYMNLLVLVGFILSYRKKCQIDQLLKF